MSCRRRRGGCWGSVETLVTEGMQQRSLLRSDVRFTRREFERVCGMSDAAIRMHLERLVAMEYVRPAMGKNGQRFEYELLFDGDLNTSAPQRMGLIEVVDWPVRCRPRRVKPPPRTPLAGGLHRACTHPADPGILTKPL